MKSLNGDNAHNHPKVFDTNVNDDDCMLCQRSIPVFLVGNNQTIMRMKERYLPPFLKRLK
tara:strand:+ start:1875 stop:2054 length:180 start_codon:yes stop_codon:yes gene_type:complete